jgi:transcriptional regulator with XRE-family HTH domain
VLPFCYVTLRGHKPRPPGYPRQLKTIGDYIRKRRLDLKLTQKKVAEGIGVSETTVQFWENTRVKPSLALMPKIIEFLGYNPNFYESTSDDLSERLIGFRKRFGLSQKKLACLAGIDPSTIGTWERGETQPTKRLLGRLNSILVSPPSTVSGPAE